MPSAVFERHQKKETLIDEFLKSVNTQSWGFQSSIDEKARSHLENLLLDNWPRDHERLKKEKNRLNQNTTGVSTTNIDEELREELDASVNSCYEEVFKEYFRYFVFFTTYNFLDLCMLQNKKTQMQMMTQMKTKQHQFY
jgi:hypothetical protein